MQIYSINKGVVKLGWLFLVLWFISAAGFIILLAARSDYWFMILPGFVFLFLWTMNVSTYPKSAIVSGNDIALIMASGKIYNLELNRINISKQKSAVALDFNDEGVERKLRISHKQIPVELLDMFKQ